ncbi:hypothetical protein ACFOUP_09085 [Belliella kenyensis]|uniref:Uncharacterized protein n=1 Tax=Belliella kenyensis TaxID=1472724 RepID=A0ABV8ELI8_9BACT|nr:hypothetical protein [Belliella kenyensis]MCH7403239.1 hypothetical protein [Belliella kenyensis]MDN3604850.1 hypothetical protein [Belliella kenyensis]
MENLNLKHFSLFLDDHTVLVKEEIPKLLANMINTTLSYDSDDMEDEAVSDALIFEGNYEKAIMIIYQGSHLEPDLRAFLFKILGAVGCSLKDIALAASESVEEVSAESVDALSPNKILVFGKLNHPISKFNQNFYEIINDNGVEYLFADDLKDVNTNVNLKKSLWTALQVLFGIKS